MIGFDVYGLNDADAFWVEYSLREQIDIIKEILKKNPNSEIENRKTLKEITNAWKKVRAINERNGIEGYKGLDE